MLIENDNHFHTLYLVVRLSALYKKTWILIRLRIRMKMITIFMYKMYNNITMYKMYLTVENLWKKSKICGKLYGAYGKKSQDKIIIRSLRI